MNTRLNIHAKSAVFLFTALFVLFPGFSQACQQYDRTQFAHWIDADSDCQSTRQEVLISESLIPVSYKSYRSCRVSAGKWYDSYSGRYIMDPSKLDIDHFVPLKEAFDSGAWSWSSQKKTRFANYLRDESLLIAVTAKLNRQKRAADPADWIPPNRAYQKEYVRTWLKIKVSWGLTADKREIEAIKAVLGDEADRVVMPAIREEYSCNRLSIQPAVQPVVKKSRSGICHDKTSKWYRKTKSFEPFDNLEDCLNSGGRVPYR